MCNKITLFATPEDDELGCLCCNECGVPEGVSSVLERMKNKEIDCMLDTQSTIQQIRPGWFVVIAFLLFSAMAYAQTTAPVTVSGTCIDEFDGDLSEQMEWSSSIDGVLGTGSSFEVQLSIGTHTISASCTDSASQEATGSVTYTVAIADNPPVVIILSPEDGGCTGGDCPPAG